MLKIISALIIVYFSLSIIASRGLLSKETDLKKDRKEKEQKTGKSNTPEIFAPGEIIITDYTVATVYQAGTTSVITYENISAHEYKTIDNLLDMIPGIKIENRTKGYPRLMIRGFDQKYTMLLIDGIPVNDAYTADVDLSGISVMNISKVIVNRGSSSALYGTDGPLGSINIITRKPTGFFASLRPEYGLYNNYSINASLGVTLKNFYYWITGNVTESYGYEVSEKLSTKARFDWFNKLIPYYLYGVAFEGVTNPGKLSYIFDRGKWEDTDYRKYNLSLKAGYNLLSNKGEIGISAGYSNYSGKTSSYQSNCYSDFQISRGAWDTGSSARPDFGDQARQVKKFAFQNSSFVFPEVYRYRISPYFNVESGKVNMKMNIFFQQKMSMQEGYASDYQIYIMDHAKVLSDNDWDDPFSSIEKFTSYGFRLISSYKTAKRNRVTVAIHWRNELILMEEKFLFPTDNNGINFSFGMNPYKVREMNMQIFSIALENEMKPQKLLKITSGISYDIQDFTKFRKRFDNLTYIDGYIVGDDASICGTRDSFNPVLGIVFGPIKNSVTIYSSVSIKTRFPNLSDYSQIDGYSVFDLKIKPERSYNGNLGLEFHILNKYTSLRSDYFFNIIDDRIAKVSDEIVTNIDSLISQGVENRLSGRIAGRRGGADISYVLSYTFVHARNEDNTPDEDVTKGKYLEFTPEHQFGIDIRLDFASKTSLIFWGIISVNQKIYVMGCVPSAVTPYSKDFFRTVDLHNPVKLNIKFSQKLWKYFEVYVMCENILDDYAVDPFNPGQGRTWHFGGRGEF